MKQFLADMASGSLPSGSYGLGTAVVAGPPSLVFAAATDQWMPVFAGVAAGIAGFCWWVYCFPQNAAVKQIVELRLDADRREKHFTVRLDSAELERQRLIKELERLSLVNARLMGRLGIETPDPDAAVKDGGNKDADR